MVIFSQLFCHGLWKEKKTTQFQKHHPKNFLPQSVATDIGLVEITVRCIRSNSLYKLKEDVDFKHSVLFSNSPLVHTSNTILICQKLVLASLRETQYREKECFTPKQKDTLKIWKLWNKVFSFIWLETSETSHLDDQGLDKKINNIQFELHFFLGV